MSLDYAVPLIIKAIVKAPRVAVIDWRWNLLVGAWRSIPNSLWTHVNMKISNPDAPLPAPDRNPFPNPDKKLKEERKDT